jgi:hypothetical protein
MARSISKQRLNTARDVGSKIVRDPHFRSSLAADASGERHIMVVAANERMLRFFARSEEIGLPLTVAVRHRGQLAVVHVRGVDSLVEHEHEAGTALKVHPNITMGMMVDALWDSDGSLLVHLIEPEEERQIDYEVTAGV